MKSKRTFPHERAFSRSKRTPPALEREREREREREIYFSIYKNKTVPVRHQYFEGGGSMIVLGRCCWPRTAINLQPKQASSTSPIYTHTVYTHTWTTDNHQTTKNYNPHTIYTLPALLLLSSASSLLYCIKLLSVNK